MKDKKILTEEEKQKLKEEQELQNKIDSDWKERKMNTLRFHKGNISFDDRDFFERICDNHHN